MFNSSDQHFLLRRRQSNPAGNPEENFPPASIHAGGCDERGQYQIQCVFDCQQNCQQRSNRGVLAHCSSQLESERP
jgi:hypothetical protein